jgi:acid phosphatase class B
MNIGLDYWQVISHYPEQFRKLAQNHLDKGDKVYVVSAVGTRTQGTVKPDLDKISFPYTEVHEVFFGNDPSLSPQLKLARCQLLGIEVFHDDRKDVCDLLNANGIIAIRVPRKGRTRKTDKESERYL